MLVAPARAADPSPWTGTFTQAYASNPTPALSVNTLVNFAVSSPLSYAQVRVFDGTGTQVDVFTHGSGLFSVISNPAPGTSQTYHAELWVKNAGVFVYYATSPSVTVMDSSTFTDYLLNGTDSQLATLLGTDATPETIAALRAGATALVMDEAACLEIGAVDPTHPANSTATTTQLACSAGSTAASLLLATAVGVGGLIWMLVDYGTAHPGEQQTPDPEPQPQPDPIVPGGPNDPPGTQVDTCQIPPGEPDVFRHYTTENGRAAITADGAIDSLSGTNYVTVAIYASGSTARADLALGSTPTGYFEIPRERLPNLEGPQCVTALNGEPGGGVEYWTNQPISAEGLTWVPIGP